VLFGIQKFTLQSAECTLQCPRPLRDTTATLEQKGIKRNRDKNQSFSRLWRCKYRKTYRHREANLRNFAARAAALPIYACFHGEENMRTDDQLTCVAAAKITANKSEMKSELRNIISVSILTDTFDAKI
jgi:hypothetical protein